MRHDFACETFDLLYPVWPAWNHELQREVFDADLTVGVKGFHQLLRSATQVAFILLNWLVCHLDLTAAGEEYLLRVASSFEGQTLDVVISCPQFSGRDFYEVREPGISIFGRASMGMNAFTTNPNWDAG